MKSIHHWFCTRIRLLIRFLPLLALGLPLGSTAALTVVTVPSPSTDALAAAVQEAGPGGKVVLAAGQHTESGTVLVDIPVTIVGEDGAEIVSGAEAKIGYPSELTPTVHVRGTRDVTVSDGANNNVLANNAATLTGPDIYLLGPGDFFGVGLSFLTTHDNLVTIGSQKGLVVIDCGINNQINGNAVLVPCPSASASTEAIDQHGASAAGPACCSCANLMAAVKFD